MSMKTSSLKLMLGTNGYLCITFPLAYVWHLVAFQATYERLHYFSRSEPIIAFGFAAILLQGILLSWIYPQLCRGTSFFGGVLKFAAIMGGYHWSMHVLAAAAKQNIQPLGTWFLIESTYLAIQFFLGSLWLGWIYRTNAVELATGE
ncbi:hypothetical protein Pan258_58820 [Symmachiella dynata]|nr:hypothetical protein Pan258_58820 [Symmachiella dynata]